MARFLKQKEKKMTTKELINGVSNDGRGIIEQEICYRSSVKIRGVSSLIFHRWSCDSIEAKSKAAKNSKAKKTDDIESYIWRDEDKNICLPGEYLRQSIIHAAKFKQDPRSPRKSAMDLFKAGILVVTELASLGSKDWDFLDRRRVVIQRNGVTRIRPAMMSGWEAEIVVEVLIPEYISPDLLNEVITNAGRLVGVGDFRPTFGRFQIVRFEVLK